MACLVLHELSKGGPARSIPAHDVLAACTGYLYALGSAHDLIRARPGSRVLVVTAEALSPLADADDFDTAILFGDAATATLVSAEGGDAAGEPFGLLSRPVLSAKGEAGQVLRVPTPKNGSIQMEGLKVYAEAVRHMIGMLEQACSASGRSVSDLDLIVPHQANARIIGDIRMRLGLPPERLLIALSGVGNTSSSSIPLALAGLSDGIPSLVGLTAFGGGYTFGAAILEKR
jgi:2-oxoisovalerate dehydrogenase E1 component